MASLAAFVVLTWPLALHPDHFWTMAGNRGVAAEPNFVNRPGGMHGGDHLQNVFIQSVVVDNVRALRSPYLDLREGAAGPTPLKTTSLDLPWTALLALLWPVTGLQAAYNAGLLLSSVATGVAASSRSALLLRFSTVTWLPAMLLLISLARVNLADHHKKVIWRAVVCSLVMLGTAIGLGVIPVG